MSKSRAVLGILGEGQLALMLGESAQAKNFSFFSKTPKQNHDELIAFAEQCSIVTLENEFYSLPSIKKIESITPVIPNSLSYAFFESKISQRKLYDSLQISSPKWLEVASKNPDQVLTEITRNFQYPFVLKKSAGGYDGNGVFIVHSKEDLFSCLKTWGHEEKIFVEEKVDIQFEFAQGALFDGEGNLNFLPLVQTVQKNGVCELVLSKPKLEKLKLMAIEVAVRDALLKLGRAKLKGLFNFEFFVTKSGNVLINEGAPRPHNSQHLSIDASPISQFDLLVLYCMTGKLPLPAGAQIDSLPGVMINLLGQSQGPEYQLTLPSFAPGLVVKPKLYGKKECRPGRKMGHLNLIDPSGQLDLISIGERARKEYRL